MRYSYRMSAGTAGLSKENRMNGFIIPWAMLVIVVIVNYVLERINTK